MNDDDLRTELRRELDAAPAWRLDVDEAGARASRRHRERTVLTAVSVVFALGVTVVSLVALSSVGQGPRGTLGSTPSGAAIASPPSPSVEQPTGTTHPTGETDARFVCDGSTTLPAEFTVAAGPAGIRIVVDNTSGEAMGFSYEQGGTNAPPGEHALGSPDGGKNWPLAPGDHEVKCVPNSVADPDTVPSATIHVVDPHGFWVSNETQCTTDQGFGSSVDFAPGAGWKDEDDAVHQALDGYAVPGDVIRHVGYPDEESPQFALVRDGRTIVLTSLFRIQGKWLYNGAQGCADEDRVKGGYHAPIQDR